MKTSITFHADGTIYLRDVNDQYNGTSAFNRGKRSLKKATAYIQASQEELEQMTIGRVCDKLDEFGLKMHMYCAID